MMKRQGRLIKVMTLSVLLLSGCNTETPEELVKKAQLHHSQGNTEVAIIELKNILQKTPQLLPALFELNSIYAGKRQYNDIINLLSFPVKEGLADQDVLYSLTDALIHVARFKDAFSIINKHPEKFKTAQGLALEGHSFAGLNKTAEANQSYRLALVLDDSLISAHLGLAQEAIISAEKNKSKQQGQTQNKNQTDWVIRNKPVATEKGKELQDARSHLQKIFVQDPDNIVANYLSATIFYLEKNITEAQRSINKVLKVDPDHKESLLLMGKLHLELVHLDQSANYLERYIKIMPQDLKARMYLASIMLRKHQPDLALELLENYSDKGKTDPEYLLILGNVYLAKSDNDSSIEYFEKAHAIIPTSALVKMYLSMGYLARSDQEKNDRGSAIQLLKEVLLIEPENKQAGISLITTLLQENDYQSAKIISSDLIRYHPKATIPRYLNGLIWQGLDNELNAISAFQKTLELNHSFIPATVRLAKIYQSSGEYELARKQFEAALYDSPYNSDVMTEMAIFEQKIGNNKKAVEILELARDRNQDALSPRLLLGTYYLRRGRVNSAQLVMDELNKLEPARPDVQMYFGQVNLAMGRSAEAVIIFSKLIEMEPDSPDLLTKYGSALRMNGQVDTAQKTLKVAWALSGGTIPEALIELGNLELTGKNYQAVKNTIDELRSTFPDHAGSFILEGDLAMRQKKSQVAIIAFQQARQTNDSTSVVLKLFEAYKQSEMNDKAFGLLDDVVRKRPDDLRLGMMFAGVKQKSGDHVAAIDIYQNLLKKYPDNALILNNLAWVYDGSDRKKALLFAEKAYQATPELPQIIDSFGWFCILDGRLEEGLSLLEIAVKKSPADPEFRYHLAEAFRLSGEKDSARKALELALTSHENFNGRNDAEELLIKLSREGELKN